MTKEDVYDERIAPLMSQIISVCKEHKIAMLATFSLDVSEGLQCTTALLTDDFEPTREMVEAGEIIYPPVPSPMMLKVSKGDGSKELHAIF